MQPDQSGQPDMGELLAQAQQMQAQLAEAQQEIADSDVEGEAGGGLVKVVMKGTGEVTSVQIDPKVIDPEDAETLQDLVVGAFQAAHVNVQELAENKLGPLASAGGLGDMMGDLGM